VRLRALHAKLLRDLRSLFGQGLTIALVVGAGIAGFVSLRATWASLVDSRDSYYERYRFGDAFVQLERAPESLIARIEAAPGVALAYSRVVEPIRLVMEGMVQPPTGVVVTLPSGGTPPMNQLFLRSGRMPGSGSTSEGVLIESFAERWGVAVGDTLRVLMKGSLRPIRVVGIGSSPEFIYPVGPGSGALPDEERFAVLWMDRRGVAPIFQMEGSFNDLVLRLHRDTSIRELQGWIDPLLEPYGGRGLIGRDLQLSNYILNGELSQLRQFATVLPMIFLGVAAFLLNVVLARTLNLQRTQIAALKALGYRDLEIALHYLQMLIGVVLGGAALGIALGWWLGGVMTSFYGEFFGFPALAFQIRGSDVLLSVGIAILAALVGAGSSLRQILRLSPAEAMRPEPPPRYRPTLVERAGVGRLLGPPGRMVLREVGRRPLRLALSSLGIAMAMGLVVVSRFSADALDVLIDQQFYRAWREDVTVTFMGPAPERSIRELRHIPGVVEAEGIRGTSARLHMDSRWRDITIIGYPEDARLRQLIDADQRLIPLPSQGLVLTSKLAELLGISVGDTVRLSLREGNLRDRQVVVTGLVNEMFGLQGHMPLGELNALLGEGPMVSQALLSIERGSFAGVEGRLAGLPRVADVTSRDLLIVRFREQSETPLLVMMFILSGFAAVIAGGVVYNNARVALSMRARDLAILRVQGFTRREISGVLLGELSVQLLLALPLGAWVGTQLAVGIAHSVDVEQYRLPIVLSAWTYGYAALVVLVAGVLTALLVRRKLDHLDLIAVLKTRE